MTSTEQQRVEEIAKGARWSWGYSDGIPGTPEYEPPPRICNWCNTVVSRCQCDRAHLQEQAS